MNPNTILQPPPQLDELGLPLGWEDELDRRGVPEPTDADLERFINGDFSSMGMMRRPPMPSAEEVRKEAMERAKEIFEKWAELRAILERHEEGLRKRWGKKTRVQRSNIILQAWPNMSPSHRPDFKALQREGPQLRTHGTKFREAFLWPYMNVEDLARGKTMLLLLNSRGRHAPYVFAKADFAATDVGRVSQAIMAAFLNVHTMLLEGTTIETYGRVVAWSDDEDAMNKAFNGLGHQPGEGLLILEIQQRILRFLVDCCHAIFHDFDPVVMIDNTPVKPEPPPLTDKSEYSTLATISAEAPYRLPSKLDFLRLKALVAAKRSSAEDHIRAMREDPGYFGDVVGDWSEHRQEKIIEIRQGQRPNLGNTQFWNKVVSAVVSNAYGALVVWHDITEQITHLANLQIKYLGVIDPRKKLPGEYMKALLVLKHTLNQTQKGLISTLKHGLPASPALRSERLRFDAKQDPLMWLFNALWTEDQLMLLGLTNIVDEIESILQRDPTEKARLSSWVVEVFSNLGLVAKIQLELERYQPWASGYTYESGNYLHEIEQDFPRRLAALAEIDRGCRYGSSYELGAPVENRFYYPSDKRRTEETTNAMRRAEASLDAFWEKLDKDVRNKTGKTLDQVVGHILTMKRPMERTPEWVAPAKPPKGGSLKKADDVPHVSVSMAKLLLDSSGKDSTKFVAPKPKIKPKTRGSAHDLPESPRGEDVTAVAEPTEPVFSLKNRPFKVFKALFYNPAQNDLPGEIAWTDFIFAMAAMDFNVEKLYGSVWQFTPTKLDVERSIQFHEPHPVGKIPFRVVRRFGRRLNRAYGWHGGMFTLE